MRINSAFVGDCELDPHLTAVVEAACEAMVNAAKHSGTDELSLLCEVEPQQVTIVVRDRGRGFDVETTSPDGGLARSITGRMDHHGGAVSIVSKPGAGTEVELTMPFGTVMADD